jgi:hypothetical protein
MNPRSRYWIVLPIIHPVAGFVWLLLLTSFSLSGFSQSIKSYRERAVEIQHEVWDDESAAFRVMQIPVDMDHESAVILATSFDVTDNSKSVMKLSGSTDKVNFRITDHARVKLNDRSALERFSTIDYLKNQSKTHFRFLDLFTTVLETYIGVKIISPDGSEKIINTDDDVYKKNYTRHGQLIIPGLKEGDILDYYVRVEQKMVEHYISVIQQPYTLLLGNKYFPTLYQKIRVRFGDYFRAQYISANGAPPLAMSQDADGTILERTLTNLSKLPDNLWISELRQMPFIKIQLGFIKKVEPVPGLFKGEVVPGTVYTQLANLVDDLLQNPASEYDDHPLRLTRDYFGGKEKMKSILKDSIVKVLYNAWYYYMFSSKLKDTVSTLDNLKNARAVSFSGAFQMSKILTSLHIENNLYLVCSSGSASFKNIIGLEDIDALLKVTVEGGRVYWMAFDDILTLINEIPDRYQDEIAIVLKPGMPISPNDKQIEKAKIPLTPASDNITSDSIEVNFNTNNMSILKIGQNAGISGSPRHYIQKDLMLYEDMEAAVAAGISKEGITARLYDENKGTREAAFQSVFLQERNNQKDYFENAITARFGSRPDELQYYELFNPELCRTENSVRYKTQFTMGNWVSNENNLYRVQIGKLLGVYPDIDGKSRSMNVYLPGTRTVNCHVIVHIPDGYQLRDAGDLNMSVKNESGSCLSTASVNGQTLEWNVSETFPHNFEPVGNWPKLAEILHAIYTLSEKKIVLEKNRG